MHRIYLSGFNPADDEVRTLAYCCLTGTSIVDILKKGGMKFGEKFTISMIKKIPGSIITKINQKVGFRFITKFGEKGIINLGKMVPGVGAAVGGITDYFATKKIAKITYKTFFKENLNAICEKNEEIEYV